MKSRDVGIVRALEYAGCTDEKLDEIARRTCFCHCGQPVVGAVRGWDLICCRPRELPFCERHRQAARQHAREHAIDIDSWDRRGKRTPAEIHDEYDQAAWEREQERR